MLVCQTPPTKTFLSSSGIQTEFSSCFWTGSPVFTELPSVHFPLLRLATPVSTSSVPLVRTARCPAGYVDVSWDLVEQLVDATLLCSAFFDAPQARLSRVPVQLF